MAASLKDLIEYLLEELSLRGDQGAPPEEILGFIDEFYSLQRQKRDGAGGDGATATRRIPKLDRPFKASVWRWLTDHPEVSVGKDREGNHLALDDLVPLPPNELSQGSVIDPALRPAPDPQRHLNVFSSPERTWLSITGHEPDFTRVLPLEFALLSIIAFRKEKGIVQSELVRLSGQDKRSVPKRTDLLQKKGYIEKRAIQYQAARTSLCTLAKFAGLGPGEVSYDPSSTGKDGPLSSKNKIIDFTVLREKLFGFLKQYDVITRNDLREKMGMQDRWHGKILRRAIRKLEAIGCVRRVRAVSEYSGTTKSLHPSVMLLREPTEKDIKMFHEDSKGLISSLEQLDMDIEMDEDEDQDQDQEIVFDPSLEASPSKTNYIVDDSRVFPQWTPEKTLPNLVFDTINQAGQRGLSNNDVNQATMGAFFRRPLETIVSRLTSSWQYPQPLHLRHLAIVRDTALHKTSYYYIYYSLRNFSSLVENGRASWDAIASSSKPGKQTTGAPPIGSKPNLDLYGFPNAVPQNLLKKGDSTIRECLEISNPPKRTTTFNDPIAVALENGTYTVDFFRKGYSKTALERARDAGVFTSDDVEPLGSNVLKRDRSSSVARQSASGHQGSPGDLTPRPLKRLKVVSDPFEGLTGKELLEAQGLDEGWTEYSLLLMERPKTGVYVTPFGKRRPVGKKRGRPGKSRIAVFKSPRLEEFVWFVSQASPDEPTTLEEAGNTPTPETTVVEPDEQAGSGNLSTGRRSCRPVRAAAQRHIYEEGHENGDREDTVQLDEAIDESDTEWDLATRQTAAKRRSSDLDVPTSTITATASVRRRGRPAKKRKLNIEPDITRAPVAESNPPVDNTPLENADEVANPIVQARLETEQFPNTPKLGQEPNSTPFHGVQAIQEVEAVAQPSTSETLTGPHQDVTELRPKVEPMSNLFGNSPTPENTELINETVDFQSPAAIAVPDTGVPDSAMTVANDINGIAKRDIRSGSVGVLRRKLILDILHKAGGLYPMGSEMWYPFTTMWLKLNQKTKPDARTIKNTIKSLIESGKARQHTFVGRNPRDIMVTKSILALPNITAGHPKMKEMQREMLDADPHLYLPIEVDVDPDLRKSNRGFSGYGVKLPDLDGEVNVTLHQPPARTRKPLSRVRHRRNLHDSEYGFFEWELDEFSPYYDVPVHRLESIRRLTQGRSYLDSFKSFAVEPLPGGPLWRGHSRSAAYLSRARMRRTPQSMLMSPIQVFHPSTGTFGTGAYIPRVHPTSQQQYRRTFIQPDSLESILAQVGGRKYETSNFSDPVSQKFFSEVDKVRNWEHYFLEVFDAPNPDLVYINHTIEELPESPPIEGPIYFANDPAARLTIEPSRRLTRQIMKRYQPPEVILARSFSAARDQRRSGEGLYPETTRKLTQIQESNLAGDVDRAARTRRIRHLSTLSEKTAQRLMVAMVVVRTLAGGVDGRMVEWALITPLFPDYSAKFVHDRGRLLTGKHRLQLMKMQSDFQEKFAEAYEKGDVPRIDFDNLESYDWEGVVNWASMNLEEPSMGKLPNLPAFRSQFDTLFEIREDPQQNIDEIYQHHPPTSIPRKRTLLANVLYSETSSKDQRRQTSRAPDLELLDVAKTWVRANVVTPDDSYRPNEAGQTMRLFGEELLGRAIQSLITERVISMGNKGRVAPGRNFDLTEHFLGTLTRRRQIESVQLKQAALFKTDVLDAALSSEGSYSVKYEAEDGHILALINLASSGRILLVPKDPPRNKYGLTDGGYLTRLMDKEKLRFTVEVYPVQGRYIYGNPIAETLGRASIPSGGLSDITSSTELSQLPKVPLWYDVHCQFVKIVWELVIAAVVGILVARPAIKAQGITRMLEPCLAEWEVDMVLEWLADAGVAKSTQYDAGNPAEKAGWMVKEWWWMTLG